MITAMTEASSRAGGTGDEGMLVKLFEGANDGSKLAMNAAHVSEDASPSTSGSPRETCE